MMADGTALHGAVNRHSIKVRGVVSRLMQTMLCSEAIDRPDEQVDHGLPVSAWSRNISSLSKRLRV